MANDQATETTERITPDDLRNRFTALQDGVQGRVDEQRTTIAGALAGGAVVLMIVFFLLGKRSGKKKSTVVEIRRV